MSAPFSLAYLNGRVQPLAAAQVSVLDRGFLFGDGVYEVVPVYDGVPFRLPQHIARLGRSLHECRIRDPHDAAGWQTLVEQLISANGGGRMSVYLQVTRGADNSRKHLFPDGVTPTVFGMCAPMPPLSEDVIARGAAAVTRADTRWARCDIKATSLLANILLRQDAADEGAEEAILVRDGFLLEGSTSSIFLVSGGALLTPPRDDNILPGTTRELLLELASACDIPLRETRVAATALATADELWLASSTREVLAITRLDRRPVGDGKPGPLWRRVYAAFQEYKASQASAK